MSMIVSISMLCWSLGDKEVPTVTVNFDLEGKVRGAY